MDKAAPSVSDFSDNKKKKSTRKKKKCSRDEDYSSAGLCSYFSYCGTRFVFFSFRLPKNAVEHSLKM